MVLQSTDPDFHQGRMVDGAKTLNIAAGQSMTLVSRAGRELQLNGPFQDRLDAFLAELPVGNAADAVPAVGATRTLDGSLTATPAPPPEE